MTDVVPLHQPPRYPDTTGAARPVRDRSVFCSRWRENGGCRLDENIIISVDDPHNGVVESWEMFEFMSLVCLDTCGWAGDKVRNLVTAENKRKVDSELATAASGGNRSVTY